MERNEIAKSAAAGSIGGILASGLVLGLFFFIAGDLPIGTALEKGIKGCAVIGGCFISFILLCVGLSKTTL